MMFSIVLASPAKPLLNLGDLLYIFFKSVSFFRSLNFGYYSGIVSFILTVLFIALVVYLVYITLKTLLMKKESAMMAVVLDQEGEVVELLDEEGKTGWVFINGENWRFTSNTPLKVGDTVKAVKNRRMKLIVEKI